jgi:hypothetical protein
MPFNQICENCGKEFKSTHSIQKFCSPKCYNEASSLKPKYCENCKKKFIPLHRSQKYCSIKCYHATISKV